MDRRLPKKYVRLMMSKSCNEGFQNFLFAIQPFLLQAYMTGHQDGFEKGRALGFLESINSLKPALSDGLRHGSPECGAAMRGLRNLGIDQSES
ncbi:hypothetical protein GPA24_19735 [Aromatoleum bremense]|uniref:DUF5610 domain-containing protein n=1 Tax=Aromatoleum bremense TaxID=76115 RepID=A0ABX1P1Z6_9RHOO|nr:hypothetical protein [Aromatoleum bremense]